MNLASIYEPIKHEMQQMSDSLTAIISDSTDPRIREITAVVQTTSGKMLRPALTLLSSKIASPHELPEHQPNLISLALSMELIHLASIVHDDVIDNTLSRRGQPSANALLGNNVSILLGDYLYSKALQHIAKCHHSEIFIHVCDAIHDMCEGELEQVNRRDCWDMSEKDYIAIISKKTAALFSISCRVGVLLGRSGSEIEIVLRDFGLHLGIAYQIADDCRDVLLEEDGLGKTPYQDLMAGDVTLPLLNIRKAANTAQRVDIENAYRTQIGGTCVDTLRGFAEATDALRASRDIALKHIKLARNRLSRLTDSVYRRSLSGLTDYIEKSL
ncbi:polyprenyl synthetase family protein [Planctomycetota bacterium]